MTQNIARQIVASFGGLAKTSEALGGVPLTTISHWQRSGNIPRWRRGAIVEAADRKGIDIPPCFRNDTVTAPSER